jgi:zinc protease
MISSERVRRLRLAAAVVMAIVLLWAAQAPAGSLAERVFETTLANGLKVLLVEEHKAPVVTVQVWYRVGSIDEQLGKTGLSHMLEHMMFKGTEKLGPKDFSRIVQRNGGFDNAFTTADYTGYYINFSSDRVRLALELEADRMANLVLKEEEFRPEHKVVMEERRLRIEDQAHSILGETVRGAAFLAHPYRWPVIGWMSDIQSYTLPDLVRHYRTYYTPNNAVLVVAGDVRKETILPDIEALFGKIPRGPDPPRLPTEEPSQRGERRIVVKKEAQLPLVFVLYHAPNLTHPDSYALDVLSSVLGSGESSRLHQRLVYEQRLASYASADYSGMHRQPHLFGLSGGSLPGKTAEELERAFYVEVERIKQEPPSDRELQKAKNQVEAEFVYAQDSVHRMANLLGSTEMVASWTLLGRYLDGIRSVTAADVQRVAAKYLTQENRTVGILVPVPPDAETQSAQGKRP